ncbi:hypothetical protein B296_00045653 [Ensete ventricosum]|uniref:Uncharacterized protein n=1 Tax=Ensete ventricosum TaxID=4639 RepID=A0A426Z6N5_ENSVE|nr:hypothetical protein B296_00045653 [Ensete ventricosum]
MRNILVAQPFPFPISLSSPTSQDLESHPFKEGKCEEVSRLHRIPPFEARNLKVIITLYDGFTSDFISACRTPFLVC